MATGGQDYKVDSKRWREYDVKYLGDILSVPLEVDITNRTDVLRTIDRGKKQKVVPLKVTADNDAVFSLGSPGLKISRRGGQEDALLVIPLIEIAATCYIKDDGINILCVKHGTQENCNMAVMHCENQDIAEAICAQCDQCFQLEYQEAMITLIEETIDIAISSVNSTMSDNSSDSTPTPGVVNDRSFFSVSQQNILFPRDSDMPQRVDRARSIGSRISTESSGPAELLRNYMWELQKTLKPEELAQFSELLKQLNVNKMQIAEFCDKLFDLYGPDRKDLLYDMFPFIPERDCAYFEEFLKKNGISMLQNGSVNSSYQGMPRLYASRWIDEYYIGDR